MKTRVLFFCCVLFSVFTYQSKAQYWKDVFSPVTVSTIKVYDSIVWVGTINGAYKFDLNGNFLQRIGGEILSLAKDNNGKMWFGTNAEGVFSFQNGVIARYNTTNGLVSNNICAMVCDLQGNMWFGSRNGLVSKFDGSQFVNYTSTHELFLKPISDIIVDRNGVVFIGQYYDGPPTANYYSGVSRYDGTWHKDTMERVYSLATNQQGEVWCVGGFKIRKWNGTSWTYVSSTPTIPQNEEVFGVACDSVGKMWFASDQNHYSFNGTTWQTFSLNNGMPNNRMFVIAFDSLNQKWIGGGTIQDYNAMGLYRYNNSSIHTFPWMSDAIPQLFNGIVSDLIGKIWMPSHHLLNYSYPNINTAIGLADYSLITCVAIDNSGNIWATSLDSIYYQSSGLWNSISLESSLQYNYISNIAFDILNLPIVACNNTLHKFNGQLWEILGDDLPSFVTSLAINDVGEIWVGTFSHGVYHYDGSSMLQFSGNNLQSDTVNDVFIDHQEALWIATNNGIAKFANNIWTNYNTLDGLINNKVSKIYQDQLLQYWFATEDGISMYNGSNWISFSNPSGFLHNSKINGIAEDTQGNLWFSNQAGICRLSDNINIVKNQVKHNLKIGVYPNPTSDKIIVTNLIGNNIINLYTVNGVQIQSYRTNSEIKVIDVQSLTSGSYILEIISNGTKSSLIFIKN